MYSISPNITKIISVSDTLIVSVQECGQWLNLSPSAIIMQNDLIQNLIITVTEIIERYTWISLRRKTFEAYYSLPNGYFGSFINGNLRLELQRSPIIDITDVTKIEYLADDIWNEFDRGAMTIDGLYVKTSEKIEQRAWASVRFRECVPYEDRCNAYKIRITFNAGYEPTELETAYKIPSVFKTAIKKIVAYHYTNRGDCESACKLNGFPVPCDVKGMLDQLSIANTIIGTEYNSIDEGCCYD